MRFLHGKVKARKGNVIKVDFSEPTRVLFMVQKDFDKYRNNLTFTYYGGQKEESPFEFVVPKATTWFVVVEKGSYHKPKNISASFALVSGSANRIETSAQGSDKHEVAEEEESSEENENPEEEKE